MVMAAQTVRLGRAPTPSCAIDDDCTDADWDTGDDPDEHLYYCQDAHFNTTALVERSDGSVVERYSCDPYGKVTIYDDDWSDTVTWANSKKNEILYCGYPYDHESRLYHVRHRSYHPTLGRWMQRDPIGYADGMSLYEYVRSDPIGSLDPWGEAAQSAAGTQNQPCCCLCVLSANLINVRGPVYFTAVRPLGPKKGGGVITERATAYGFAFQIEVKYEYVEVTDHQPPEGTMEWWERHSAPAAFGDKVFPANRWFNAVKELPKNTKQEQQWESRTRQCPSNGPLTVTIDDEVGEFTGAPHFERDARGGYSRFRDVGRTLSTTIDFDVIFKSSDDPQCKTACLYGDQPAEVGFSLEIKLEGGKGATDDQGHPRSWFQDRGPHAPKHDW